MCHNSLFISDSEQTKDIMTSSNGYIRELMTGNDLDITPNIEEHLVLDRRLQSALQPN